MDANISACDPWDFKRRDLDRAYGPWKWYQSARQQNQVQRAKHFVAFSEYFLISYMVYRNNYLSYSEPCLQRQHFFFQTHVAFKMNLLL